MSAPYFLWTERFDLTLNTDSFLVDFSTIHPKATVVGVERGQERAQDGQVEREFGLLLIKDRGMVAEEHTNARCVIVTRRLGDLTHLPDAAGERLGTFSTDHGQHVWDVWTSRMPEARAPREKSAPAPAADERPRSHEGSPTPEEDSRAPSSTGDRADSSASAPLPPEEDSVWP